MMLEKRGVGGGGAGRGAGRAGFATRVFAARVFVAGRCVAGRGFLLLRCFFFFVLLTTFAGLDPGPLRSAF